MPSSAGGSTPGPADRSPADDRRPDFSKSGRPPWTKPMEKSEWDDFLAAAREIGNPIEGWAVHVHYIETALAHRVFHLEMTLRRIALGMHGRRESGLLPDEITESGQPKTDWQLAQEVLDV